MPGAVPPNTRRTATSWAQHRALTNLFAPPSEDEEVPDKEAPQTPPRGGRTPD